MSGRRSSGTSRWREDSWPTSPPPSTIDERSRSSDGDPWIDPSVAHVHGEVEERAAALLLHARAAGVLAHGEEHRVEAVLGGNGLLVVASCGNDAAWGSSDDKLEVNVANHPDPEKEGIPHH